jgi:outer membrane protein assembly factor BamA
VFSVGELRPLLSLQEGDVFNVTKIRDSLDAIHRRYIEYGYFNFVATPVTEVNDSKQRISLIFELDQGKQFRISKVEVRGSVPGSEAKLISKLHPGDIFKPSGRFREGDCARLKRRGVEEGPQSAQKREKWHGRNQRRFPPASADRSSR